MDALLLFLKNAEVWIYALLGLVGLIYARKFIIAWTEYRRALFGLERDNAQRKVGEAASILILALAMTAGEFILASFVVPAYPAIQGLPTATLSVLTTPLPPPADGGEAGTPTAALTPVLGSNCHPGSLEFTDPTAGGTVTGKVTLKGTVKTGDFGFYKYQFAQAGSESWVTIAAGNTQVVDGVLGPWDTTSLTPGDYQLRLVVTGHQGEEQTPCTIPISITAP